MTSPHRCLLRLPFLRVTGAGVALLCALAETESRAAPAAEAVEFFETKIRPVLAQDCYECHRTGGKRKGGLALDHRQALLEGGDSGRVIVPGDPAASLLLQAIRHEQDDLKMPKAGAKLEPSVIADFERWVKMGAPDPRDAPPTEAQVAADTDWDAVMQRRKSWWSFQPIKKPTPPKTSGTRSDAHPIDQFLGAKLDAAKIARAPRADPATLLRRLNFALHGLPPSVEEIANAPTTASRTQFTPLVDALLASPRFGERWARHWMDWTRYADSHGSEGDAPVAYAWRYRDYLIRALNADVPYDQLVREHLAGDLLERPRLNPALGLNESALGIGHLRMVLHGFAPTDALDELGRFTDDQVNVVSKAFLGLTVSCARCHNHKFDPISQKDFSGWYGIFTSTAPATIAVDAPSPTEGNVRAELTSAKAAIRDLIATAWEEDAAAIVEKLTSPAASLAKAIAAAKAPAALLHPFWRLQSAEATSAMGGDLLSVWRAKVAATTNVAAQVNQRRWNLARPEDFATWRHDGNGATAPSPAGAFAIAPGGDLILTGIYPAGVYSHLISSKDRGVLFSPKIQLEEKNDLWLRLAGEGGAFARFVVQNYPREGTVYPVQKLVQAQQQWLKLPLDYWQGDQIHIEFTTAADQPVLANPAGTRSWFGVSEVVLTPTGAPGPTSGWEFAEPILAAAGSRAITTAADLAEAFGAALRTSAAVWRQGHATDGQALFLDQLLRAGLLRNRPEEIVATPPLLAAYRALEAEIRVPTRAPGVIETGAVDQPLFTRGNHKQPAGIVPRHFLDAIDGKPYAANESGRRALAEDLVRPDNPLPARVIVNRVWHHLFGRGLVATPDNFGRMGEAPSHPDLLDYLATWFVDHRWSIKELVKFIVTSETWQLASAAPAVAAEKDPDNVLLSHAPVRRIEAEAIRDALLAVSGDLKTEAMFGPPVLGGVPRRSVYLRVKRNDLDPFLAAFDAPAPSGPVGQRDLTNVPAQALTLLNDSFVRDRAEHWARRLEADATLPEPAERIRAMWFAALGRAPTAEEIARAETFVTWAAQEKSAGVNAPAAAVPSAKPFASPWADLAHAIFNLKEFIFLR